MTTYISINPLAAVVSAIERRRAADAAACIRRARPEIVLSPAHLAAIAEVSPHGREPTRMASGRCPSLC
ncbi:MAG TPA: hypothetical protein VMU96_08170 [Casimicrobiaceae bacterium]|nr:hypothetical protein [Casimicrobiaceae bacterium]